MTNYLALIHATAEQGEAPAEPLRLELVARTREHALLAAQELFPNCTAKVVLEGEW